MNYQAKQMKYIDTHTHIHIHIHLYISISPLVLYKCAKESEIAREFLGLSNILRVHDFTTTVKDRQSISSKQAPLSSIQMAFMSSNLQPLLPILVVEPNCTKQLNYFNKCFSYHHSTHRPIKA